MISEAEIRRFAATTKVDPMVIDLDYSLGWFLLGLAKTDKLARGLRFKGGTCLRKCYFADYRFSEDLDFTLEQFRPPEHLESDFEQIMTWVTREGGPDFSIEPLHFEVVNDDYGSESFQARLYYRGPLKWGGSPRTVRIDVTRQEKLALPAVKKILHHPYSDQDLFQDASLLCYSLEEVMAEKLRAAGGQRRFAISRDIYDISNLLHAGVDFDQVKTILPEKFLVKGLDLSQFKIEVLENREDEFKLDWDRRLSYLVRDDATFEKVWADALQVYHDILQK